MSNSSEKPWSDHPNAPQIPYDLYLGEKSDFAGVLIGAIFYGIVIVLFFQCMGALLNPDNRMKRRVKWSLIAHTVAMFSFITLPASIHLRTQSVSYVDTREFPGAGPLPPGPLGYQYFTYYDTIENFPKVMFPLNQWLADGLLLYRCYIIYAMNYWAIAFPFLMYLATVAMGIAFLYRVSQPLTDSAAAVAEINFGTSYYSLAVALNVVLTVMIATRLVLHSRNVRNAMGGSAGFTNGLYTAVVTMLIESSAPYAVAFLLYIGPWAADSPATNIFTAVVGDFQVIAPFLITLRVANRRALTSEAIVSGNIGSIHFKTQAESTSGDEAHSEVRNHTETNAGSQEDHSIRLENTIEEVTL